MAISTDSRFYTIEFEDGSNISVINSMYLPELDRSYTLGLARFVRINKANFDAGYVTTEKTDLNGNTWVFEDTGDIRINNNTLRATNVSNILSYNPQTHRLDYRGYSPFLRHAVFAEGKSFMGNYYQGTGASGYTLTEDLAMVIRWETTPQFLFYNLSNVTEHGEFASSAECYLHYTTQGQTLQSWWSYQSSSSGGYIDLDLNDTMEDLEPSPPIGDDPYNENPDGGETGTGGGTGDFDGTSDPVDFPTLPSLSAVDTGFITLYNPSLAELQSLASYMWSTNFDLDTFRKLFADPMDAILGLSIVPVNVPSAGSQVVTVGNISTGVSMTKAAGQYVEVDCGTINVHEYWGSYLDYDPYTKAEIYLPYIGSHAIAADDIMGKSVHVKYHVDVLSGACTAYIKCGDSILYEFIGQCASSIPVSGRDFTSVINGAITIAGSIGSMIATGGATAPLAIPALASTALNDMKPDVEKSGSMSGTGGLMAIQTPYLILTRPRQAVPKNQNKYTGYPSFITKSLGSLKGYTEVDMIRLNGMGGATDEEISEINSLLKSGVIL